MKTIPKVSIIIPVYNVEKYIGKCLESIIYQTFKNYEVIVIDDGSKDNSLEVCNLYAKKDERIKVYHKENSGAPSALNFGLKKASGEYLWFIDADDFIDKNALDFLTETADASGADMILFGARTVNAENGEPNNLQTEYWSLSNVNNNYRTKLITYTSIMDWLINLPTVPWNKFHRRTFINSHKILFDEELLAPYDCYFNLCCYLNGAKLFFCKEVLYNYRLSEQSTTAKLVAHNSPKWAQPILLAQKTDKLIKKQGVNRDLYKIFVKRTLKHIFFWFRRCKGNSVKKYYVLMREYFKNLDKDIYTEKNLQESEEYLQYLKVKSTPYLVYLLERTRLVKYEVKQSSSSFKILGCKVWKKKQTEVKKIYFLGIPIFKKTLQTGLDFQVGRIMNKLEGLNREINNLKVYVKVTQAHAYFSQYRNIYKGKDIVILATGPSAQKYIPKTDCIHIGVNGATKFKNIKLDYLFVQDLAIETEMNEQANKCDCIKFYGHHADARAKALYPNVKRIPMSTRLNTNANIYLIEDLSWGAFASELTVEPFGDFHSTVFSALQFALYTNPVRIFLVGCDCTNGYFYDSLNPFHNSTNVLRGWNFFKKFAKDVYPDVKIISINPVGLRGMFEDMYN